MIDSGRNDATCHEITSQPGRVRLSRPDSV